jgi:hypothetical protein
MYNYFRSWYDQNINQVIKIPVGWSQQKSGGRVKFRLTVHIPNLPQQAELLGNSIHNQHMGLQSIRAVCQCHKYWGQSKECTCPTHTKRYQDLCSLPPTKLTRLRSKDIQDIAWCYGNEKNAISMNPPRRPLSVYFLCPSFYSPSEWVPCKNFPRQTSDVFLVSPTCVVR